MSKARPQTQPTARTSAWLIPKAIACLVMLWAAPVSTQASTPDADTGVKTRPAEIEFATDASLVLRFDDLASAVRSPAGETLRAALADLGVFGQTAESWAALSDALGLSPDEAIDGLLGGHVLLLAGGPSSNAAASDAWACAMSVDPGLARRMAKSLNAAPRGTESGRTVYAIEDGKLAVVPLKGWSRIVVATAGNGNLRRVAEQIALAWGTPAGEPSVTVNDRTRKGADAEPDDSSVGILVYKPADAPWLTGTIHTLPGSQDKIGDTAPGWALRFTARDPRNSASNRGPRPDAPGIDRSWYDTITAEAGIAYAGPVGGSSVHLPISLGPFGDDLQNLRKWTGVFLPFDPPPSLLRDEADFGVFTAGSERSGSVWLRVPDASRAAKIGDAYVCDLVTALAGAGAVAVDDPECTGQFPVAIRRIEFPDAGPRRHDLGDLGFAWGATRVSVLGSDREPMPWWFMHSIPAGRRPSSIAPGLSADPDTPLVRFTIRPHLLIDRLGDRGAHASIISAAAVGGLDGLQRIALVDLEIVETPPTRAGETPGTTGRLVLRVHPTKNDEVGSPG